MKILIIIAVMFLIWLMIIGMSAGCMVLVENGTITPDKATMIMTLFIIVIVALVIIFALRKIFRSAKKSSSKDIMSDIINIKNNENISEVNLNKKQ